MARKDGLVRNFFGRQGSKAWDLAIRMGREWVPRVPEVAGLVSSSGMHGEPLA